MTDRILKDEWFEELRLYDADTNAHKLVSKKIKEIFSNLFVNTNVNVDDFYFMVFDDTNPNAWFLDKTYTTNKKQNIVAVSSGLITACNNEAELAGIVAHECGHYLWGELIGGRNTIFQEHGADLYAIDLMMNAGFVDSECKIYKYNPRWHLQICSRIFADYGRHSLGHVTINVHGNGIERIVDIKDYMAKISNEIGDFPDIDVGVVDKKYSAFQKQFESEKEVYDTYIDKKLKEKFNTSDVLQIPLEGLLKLFLDGIRSKDMIGFPIRFFDLCNKIQICAEKGRLENRTEQQIQICQDLFMEFAKLETSKRSMPWLYDYGTQSEIDRRIDYTLNALKLNAFGSFSTLIEYVDKFVNFDEESDNENKWKENALERAHNIYDLCSKFHYYGCIKYFIDGKYSILTAKQEKNIGRKFPWVVLQDILRSLPENAQGYKELDFVLQNFCHEISFDGKGLWEYSKYGKTRDKNSDIADYYYLNENGIVIAYGEEAKALHEIDRDSKNRKEAEGIVKEFKKNFDSFFNFYNTLALFCVEKEQNKKKEYANILINFIRDRNYICGIKGVLVPYKFPLVEPEMYKNVLDDMKKKYKESEFCKFFVSKYDDKTRQIFLYGHQAYLKARKEQSEIVLDMLKLQDSVDIYKYPYLKKRMVFAWLNFLNFIQNREDFINLYEQIKSVFDIYDGYIDKDGYFDDCIIDEGQKKLLTRDIRLMNNDLLEKYKRSLLSIKNVYELPFACKENFGTWFSNDLSLNTRESYLIRIAMQTFGLDYSKSFIENAHCIDNFKHKEILSESGNFYITCGVYIFVDNIKRGIDYDLESVMEILQYCKVPYSVSAIVPDLIAQSIQKGNKFYTLSLDSKIFVYEIMEKHGLFSNKYANQLSFFKSIVHDIINFDDRKKTMEYAEAFLIGKYIKLEYGINIDKDRKNSLRFEREKNLLIDFVARVISDELGIDDGTDAFYIKTINKLEILQKKGFSADDFHKICNAISTNIVSQELTTKKLDEVGQRKYSGRDAENNDLSVRAGMALISILAHDERSSKMVIDFLTGKCTDESMEKIIRYAHDANATKFIKDYLSKKDIQIKVDKYELKVLHENFWSINLPLRAVIMERIIDAYVEKFKCLSYEEERALGKKNKKFNYDEEYRNAVKQKAIEQKVQSKKLDLILDMFFDKKSKYYKDAKLVINAVYNNLQEYEQDLIIAALLSANMKDSDKKTSNSGEQVGQGLKIFFENKGPAFVKFGQLLSYLPMLDADIRKPLATLRDKADIPTRAELFSLLKETLPNSELKKITRVDKILGAGSFFITVKVKYDNQDCVVAVMRPHAKELSDSGMKMINNTIQELSEQDKKYKALKNIATQASKSATSETNIVEDYAKFIDAIQTYGGMRIITPYGTFAPNVAKWKSYGTGKDGQVYKIMDEAPGISMTSNKMSTETKHDMAVAYTTLELCLLLSGTKWDTDRHQGQQNLFSDGYKNFIIGIFDTGARLMQEPSRGDKFLLGDMLYDMARAARNGESISDYMISKIQKIDKAGKILNFDVQYIDAVQRGLTALSDVITYQKEIKDVDGNIVQSEQSLTGEDLSQIMNAILRSDLIDSDIKKALKTKAILNKLQPLRKGWAKSFSEGIKQVASLIKIERDKMFPISFVNRIDKPKEEIEANDKEFDAEHRCLGVPTDHIVLKNTDKSGAVANYVA